MRIREYRIVMPMTVDEYKIGQLYAILMSSKTETGGGEGVEVLQNEPFDNQPLFDNFNQGQYTYKKYYLKSKTPAWLQKMFPDAAFILDEKAWNAYPFCKTVVTVFNLRPETLKLREVVFIDITVNPGSASDYKPEFDPKKFKSKKTDRGPLGEKWHETVDPVMCCYKLVTLEFKWACLQSFVEKSLQNQYPKIFGMFNRQLFCQIDDWIELTIEDIRHLEEEAKEELKQKRLKGQKQGTTFQ